MGSLDKIARALKLSLSELLADDVPTATTPKSEKRWYRIAGKLRDRDDRYLRGVEHLLRALDAAQG